MQALFQQAPALTQAQSRFDGDYSFVAFRIPVAKYMTS